MNREFGSKGYQVVADTSQADVQFYGISVLADAVISAMAAPSSGNELGTGYDGDEAGIAGPTLPAGVFYPIRGSSITLASGTVILWIE